MDKATGALRRSGAFLLSFGSSHKELKLIISDLKSLKSQLKTFRDMQQTVLHDITNWTCVDENRAFQELLLHLSDLNELWNEVQTNFAEQVTEFRHQFERILEGKRKLDALRSKVSDLESLEEKAQKKLKKANEWNKVDECATIKAKIEEYSKQKRLMEAEETAVVKENEAVKLIVIKNGFLKLSQAYLAMAQKCIYIFEAQRNIIKCLPDVGDRDISEITFSGFPGAKDILQRARTEVTEYRILNQSSSTAGNADPPPPYSPNPHFANYPYNPYFSSPGEHSDSSPRNDASRGLYPPIRNAEELSDRMSAAKIGPQSQKDV